MKRYAFGLTLLLLATSQMHGAGMQQRRKAPPAWYERAAGQINPDDKDCGSVWEQRKQDFINQLGNPYFRYGLGATGAVVMLGATLFALYVRHRPPWMLRHSPSPISAGTTNMHGAPPARRPGATTITSSFAIE